MQEHNLHVKLLKLKIQIDKDRTHLYNWIAAFIEDNSHLVETLNYQLCLASEVNLFFFFIGFLLFGNLIS